MENTSGQDTTGLASRIRDRAGRFSRVQRLGLGLIVLGAALGMIAAIMMPVMGSGAEPAPPAMPLAVEPQPVQLAALQSDASAPAVTLEQAVPASSAVADTRLMAPEEFKAGSSRVDDPSQAGRNAGQQIAAKPRKAKSSGHRGRNKAVAPEKPALPDNVIRTKYNDVMTAVVYRDVGAVTQLLELGWWVDKPDQVGYTPLMEAVSMGNAGMAELLLERGANPNVRGGAALKIARRNHDAEMEALLLHYGAK